MVEKQMVLLYFPNNKMCDILEVHVPLVVAEVRCDDEAIEAGC